MKLTTGWMPGWTMIENVLRRIGSEEMAENPMAYSEALARRIRQQLAQIRSVEEKKMFGGVGFLLNGNMLVGIWNQSLIARVGPEQYEDAMQKPFVGEFDITGRAMKGWVLITPEGIDEESQLTDWIQRALKIRQDAACQVRIKQVGCVRTTRYRSGNQPQNPLPVDKEEKSPVSGMQRPRCGSHIKSPRANIFPEPFRSISPLGNQTESGRGRPG